MTDTADPNAPNLFELAGDDTTVSYSTSGFDGRPRLRVSSGGRGLSFTGTDIESMSTALGAEVTVTIEVVEDRQTVTLTLVVPDINLGDAAEAEFETVAVQTTSATSIGGPALVTGAVQTYQVVSLRGTARSVEF